MLKKCFTILFLLAALGAAARAEASTTVLVYLCGANLQAEACEDISEMCLAETGENVNVVVLAGGAEQWDFDEIRGGTRNLIILRDGGYERIDDWGWASMGSEESLLAFLEYGLTQYPADRTAVVLWDHGAGSAAGLCFDDTTEDQDGLTLNEINDVLYDLNEKTGGFHIDVFGCDACMMATYEMATLLSYYDIDYYVASEEIEPGIGWDYTTWLKALNDDPGLSTEALCTMIVDSYMEAGLREVRDDYLTLSAVDLRQVQTLQETMEAFASVLLGELETGNVATVRRERSRMYTFGSFVDGSWDMVDLGAMLDAYAGLDAEAAAQARRQLRDSVLYSRQTENLGLCSGLSALIPQDTKDEFESYSDGVDLSFYIPNWIGFVKAYAGQLQSGSHSFTQAQVQQTGGAGFFSHLSDLMADTGAACAWNEDTGGYDMESEPAGAEAIGDGGYAFTTRLSEGDLRYLDYVEGMLLMDISDDALSGFVDFGLIRNNLVDWKSGDVYSLFDGMWPVFGGQMVPLYDQVKNERGRRSLIPVKLNGEETYLVVEFPEGGSVGSVLGTNAGYDANGLPVRTTRELEEGDILVPVYTLYVDNGGEDMEESAFDGDPIPWQPGMTVTYEDLSDDEAPIDMLFCFVLNDIFGGYDLTDPVAFEL